jgi:hypothetical protein
MKKMLFIDHIQHAKMIQRVPQKYFLETDSKSIGNCLPGFRTFSQKFSQPSLNNETADFLEK